MSIYFDFKTINELTGDNHYRQPKEYSKEELSQYDGSEGRPAYVAIDDIVYDISNSTAWSGGMHYGLMAGQDLTNEFNSCHGMMDILSNAPKVGILKDEDDMDNMNDMDYMNNMNYMNDRNDINFQYYMTEQRQVNQDTSKFSPDDWVRYITPVVTYALREPTQGMNTQNLYQRVILMGVLIGLGKTPQEAMDQVRDWQNTGASQILKSGTSTGGSGTTSGSGTGVGGTGSGLGTGGTGVTTGGSGTTSGSGTGFGGTGTGSGLGTGGTGVTTGGSGTTSGSGTGFGGTGTGSGLGTGGTGVTTGGSGTTSGSGTGFGGTGTGSGLGTGGTGVTTGGSGTTSGSGTGFGGTGTGSGLGTGGTTGGAGTGTRIVFEDIDEDFGMAPGESTGSRFNSNTNNRLYFD